MQNLKIKYKNKKHQHIDDIKKDLASFLGERVSEKDFDRISLSRDFWPITNILHLENTIPALPDLVTWPENEDEIVQIVKLANRYTVPLTVFGEGSGVLGSAIPIRGGIMIDMKRMDRVIEINDKNLTVLVQAGMNGMLFEHYLNNRGYTMGQHPQSMVCSTIGGWIGCNAAGHFSTEYGKMENMIIGLKAVTGNGTVIGSNMGNPASSTGPDIMKLFTGSEGLLGIVTEALLKIVPFPEKREFLSFGFRDMGPAIELLRMLMRSGIYPAVVRLYDEDETKRHFYNFRKLKKVAVIFVIEGKKELVEFKKDYIRKRCLLSQATEGGEEPVKHWFDIRFNVTEASKFPPYGIVYDTIEVSTMWDGAELFYKNVRDAIRSVKGVVLGSAHASHIYREGLCFYFTFGGVAPRGTTKEEFYSNVWDAAMRSVLKNNGAISHHHGIGIMRSRYFKEYAGTKYGYLKKIKNVFDPNGILNPGKYI